MDFCFDCTPADNQISSGIFVYVAVYFLMWCFYLRHMNYKRRFNVVMLLCFMSVALDLTLFPLSRTSQDLYQFNPNLTLFRFITEIHLYGSWQVLKLTVFNILLFVPIGYYAKKSFSSLGNIKLLMLLLGFSLFIESTQALCSWLGTSYRIFDVDDLLVNVLGGSVGVLLSYVPLRFKPFAESKLLQSYPVLIDVYGLALMFLMCYLGNHIIY